MDSLLSYIKDKSNRKNLITVAVLLLALPVGIILLRSQQIFNPRASADPIVFSGSSVEVINGKKVLTEPEVTLQITSKLGGVAPAPRPLSSPQSSPLVVPPVGTSGTEGAVCVPESPCNSGLKCSQASPIASNSDGSGKCIKQSQPDAIYSFDFGQNNFLDPDKPFKITITSQLDKSVDSKNVALRIDNQYFYLSGPPEGPYTYSSQGLSRGLHEIQLLAHCEYKDNAPPDCSKSDLKFNVIISILGGALLDRSISLPDQIMKFIGAVSPFTLDLGEEIIPEVKAQVREGFESCDARFTQACLTPNENKAGTMFFYGGVVYEGQCVRDDSVSTSDNTCYENLTVIGGQVPGSYATPASYATPSTAADLSQSVTNCKGEVKTLAALKQELVTLGWDTSKYGPLDTREQILNGYTQTACPNGNPNTNKIMTCNGPKTVAEMQAELRVAGGGEVDSSRTQEVYNKTACKGGTLNANGTVTTCKEESITIAQLDGELKKSGYNAQNPTLNDKLEVFRQAACPLGNPSRAVQTCKTPLNLGGPTNIGELMRDLRAANFPDQGFRNTNLQQAIIAYNLAQPVCNARQATPPPAPVQPEPAATVRPTASPVGGQTPVAGLCPAPRDFSKITRGLVAQNPMSSDPLLAKICNATGQTANCVIDVASHFKGYDTEDNTKVGFNTMIIIAKGKLWWVSKVFDSTKPETLPKDAGNTTKFTASGNLFRYILADGEQIENFEDFKPICDEGKRIGGGSYPEGYCRVTEYSHFKGYDNQNTNSPDHNTAFAVGYGKYVWTADISKQGGERIGQRRLLQKGNVTDIPELNEICKSKPASDKYCVIETYNHFKGHDQADTNAVDYNTALASGYGKYVWTADISKQGGERIGQRRLLLKGNLTDIPELNKICSCGTGTCVVNNMSHFKDWDTADTNINFMTGYGWYWVFNSLQVSQSSPSPSPSPSSSTLPAVSKPGVAVSCNTDGANFGANITWTGNPGKGADADSANKGKVGFYVDISPDRDFKSVYNKFVEGTNTATTLDGLKLANDGADKGKDFNVNIGQDYFVRVYNGKHSETRQFSAVCPNQPKPPVFTVSVKAAETRDALAGATSIPYTTEPLMINYQFQDKQIGQKFIFVEYTASDGTKSIESANIELVDKPPTIASTNCVVDLQNTNNIKFTLKGEKFGSQPGTIVVGNKKLDIEGSWGATEVNALMRSANQAVSAPLSSSPEPEGSYKVILTRSDGRVTSERCSVGLTQLSLGAQLFCREPNSFALTDVDMVLVRLDENGNKTRDRISQKVIVDPNGYIKLNRNLQEGQTYEVSLKAPRSLRRVTRFTASGNTNSLSNFILPVGDVAPLPNGDGVINTLDRAELNSEWKVSSPSASLQPSDFNKDFRVNSIDWACMRYDFGSASEPQP